MVAAGLPARHEPGIFEHLHVLRGSGKAHPQWLGQLADGPVAEREAGEHAAPGRIGQCLESYVQSIFNHKVQYGGRGPIVNRLVERCTTFLSRVGQVGPPVWIPPTTRSAST